MAEMLTEEGWSGLLLSPSRSTFQPLDGLTLSPTPCTPTASRKHRAAAFLGEPLRRGLSRQFRARSQQSEMLFRVPYFLVTRPLALGSSEGPIPLLFFLLIPKGTDPFVSASSSHFQAGAAAPRGWGGMGRGPNADLQDQEPPPPWILFPSFSQSPAAKPVDPSLWPFMSQASPPLNNSFITVISMPRLHRRIPWGDWKRTPIESGCLGVAPPIPSTKMEVPSSHSQAAPGAPCFPAPPAPSILPVLVRSQKYHFQCVTSTLQKPSVAPPEQ